MESVRPFFVFSSLLNLYYYRLLLILIKGAVKLVSIDIPTCVTNTGGLLMVIAQVKGISYYINIIIIIKRMG